MFFSPDDDDDGSDFAVGMPAPGWVWFIGQILYFYVDLNNWRFCIPQGKKFSQEENFSNFGQIRENKFLFWSPENVDSRKIPAEFFKN